MNPGVGALLVPAGLALALFALSLSPAVAASPPLAFSFRAAAAALVAGAALVALLAQREGRRLRLRFVLVRAHWVQTLVHLCLYAAWARSWDGVTLHAPHIAAQLLFYYGFDLLLSWWRRDEASTGFGAIPIIGSVNLFLWFRDDVFVLQFAMLVVGALAKELVHWERDGRRAHVFNPSSFPLFFVCVILWISGTDGHTFAGDIAVTQGLVPHAWIGVFLLGLVVQSLFATTLVTLSAVATLYALNLVYTQATGVYVWVDVGIPAAVFLGCTFLVTDPATSPRTARGRAGFGALYGVTVFLLYLWLRATDGPAYYDKLLCVPLLNLMVRWLDGFGGPPARARANLAWVAAGAALFAVLFGARFLGPDHPGNDIPFWEKACLEDRWYACRGWTDLIDEACHEGDWQRCEEYALLEDEGVHIDLARADAGYHLILACQEGWQPACDRLPAYLASGGEAALQESCDADDGLSCMVLGTIGYRPIDGESPGPDAIARARAFVDRACELGVADACSFLDR